MIRPAFTPLTLPPIQKPYTVYVRKMGIVTDRVRKLPALWHCIIKLFLTFWCILMLGTGMGFSRGGRINVRHYAQYMDVFMDYSNGRVSRCSGNNYSNCQSDASREQAIIDNVTEP